MSRARCACGRPCSRAVGSCKRCLAAKREAFAARLARVNAALAAGGTYEIGTAFGRYQVLRFTPDVWGVCVPVGERRGFHNERRFCLHGGHVAEAARALGVES